MPYVNIALNTFGLVVTLIIFFSCLEERLKKENSSNGLILVMIAVMVALIADTVGWIGEGHPSLAYMTAIGNTVAACAGYIATFFFMLYLKKSVFRDNKTVTVVVIIFAVLCLISILFVSNNAYTGASFTVDESGHYVHGDSHMAMLAHLQFPIVTFVTIILMSSVARGVRARNKIFYVTFAAFPAIGAVIDYLFHGYSLTYIGMVVGIMIIYTNIYLQKRQLISEQKTALMMSQINPHFMYNTLTTIASLCEISPKEAKSLTIEFSSFLRQNLDTLTTTELIPFEQELRHVGCYLKIEKARFKERLNVVYAIDCKEFNVPALTIQPLVENAVRHGITKKSSGGTVKISTYCTEDAHVIEVKDDGVGFDDSTITNDGRSHIGLNNVRNRLKDMCGGTMEIKSMPGVGTRITVSIPNKKRK